MRVTISEGTGRRIATTILAAVSVAALLTPPSPAWSAPSRCRVDPITERPVDLLQAFVTSMKLGPWIKFHEEGSDALYMSPRTDVRIGIERSGHFVRTATVLTSELQDSDRVRFQRATTFLLARIANMPEESARGDVAEALLAASRARQEQSITRGDAVLMITPVEVSG